MAQAILLVTAHLERDGARPEDDVVHTMHFDADVDAGWWDTANSEEGSLIDGLFDRMTTFYTNMAPHMSPHLSGKITIKAYRMDDPKPRIPRYSRQFTITPGVDPGLPAELAVCVSYAASPKSGVNQARRRGRVFFGPLNTTWLSAGVNDVRPLETKRLTLVGQFGAMAKGNVPGAFRLCIYSPTAHGSGASLDEATVDAETVWADDAFDIIRKRGAAPTSRYTLPGGL